jgi:hypothetical protein
MDGGASRECGGDKYLLDPLQPVDLTVEFGHLLLSFGQGTRVRINEG